MAKCIALLFLWKRIYELAEMVVGSTQKGGRHTEVNATAKTAGKRMIVDAVWSEVEHKRLTELIKEPGWEDVW